MRLIIAGSRNIPHYKSFSAISHAVRTGIGYDSIHEVVVGGARGVDTTAARWANENKIRVRLFKAAWKNRKSSTFDGVRGFDPVAGFERNVKMANYADRLLAIWDGVSAGTQHMIETMNRLGKPVDVVRISPADPPESHVTGGITRAGVPESAAPPYTNPRPSAKSDGEGRRRAGLVSR